MKYDKPCPNTEQQLDKLEACGLPLAIWVACEVWDFGTLSTLYDGMREAEQDGLFNAWKQG